MANPNFANMAARAAAQIAQAKAAGLPPPRRALLVQRTMLDAIQKNVSPGVVSTISRNALARQSIRKHKSYYSAVRFQFTPTPNQANPNQIDYRLTMNQPLRAFSYGLGDSMETAGFIKDFGQATEAETNLIAKGDTNGATVNITGISLYLGETSDARLTQLIWANTWVDCTLNVVDRYVLIGRMGRIPAAGGLYGSGASMVQTPTASARNSMVSSLTNGMPQMNNYLRLGEKIRWNPLSREDSKFQVRFQVARPIAAQAIARPGATGIEPFDPPTKSGQEGTYVDVLVYLQCEEIAPRSKQH